MLSRHIEYEKPVKLSTWRKIALGTWRTVRDPSAYGTLVLDVTNVLPYIEKIKERTGKRITITHFVGKAMAEAIRRHPEINCNIRWGRLYQRKHVSLFFQVATDDTGADLTGTLIRDGDQKSIEQFSDEMEANIKKIRNYDDPAFQKMKKTLKWVPAFLMPCLLDLIEYFTFTLNLWSPLLGTPKDPFGSIMITNIGSLGLDEAFAPIVAYSRVPILIVVGSVKDDFAIENGQFIIKKTLKLSATIDHRLVDGMHASHMMKTIRKIFQDPENQLAGDVRAL